MTVFELDVLVHVSPRRSDESPFIWRLSCLLEVENLLVYLYGTSVDIFLVLFSKNEEDRFPGESRAGICQSGRFEEVSRFLTTVFSLDPRLSDTSEIVLLTGGGFTNVTITSSLSSVRCESW